MLKEPLAEKLCLVVDDSRVVRKVSRRILEEIGFDVAEAADGVEALAWCRASMPAAILLDWNMPQMDGLEFLKQLRREPDGESPVVVFCSVENDVDHISRALEAGATEYIMKPFDSDIIEAKFGEAGLL
jgi:two-component system, chemotaxis family, chemotaxis protein CheY